MEVLIGVLAKGENVLIQSGKISLLIHPRFESVAPPFHSPSRSSSYRSRK